VITRALIFGAALAGGGLAVVSAGGVVDLDARRASSTAAPAPAQPPCLTAGELSDAMGKFASENKSESESKPAPGR
jgi:hypothetical protein